MARVCRSGAREKAEAESVRLIAHLDRVAEWVKSRSEFCRHLSLTQVQLAIAKGLLTAEEAEAAGFRDSKTHV